MTMRGLRAGGTPPRESGQAEREARIEEGKAESRRQRAIFEAGKAEILAAHPGKHIAVCAGEVFAGDTVEEAAQMARRAHGGRASFFYTLRHRPEGADVEELTAPDRSPRQAEREAKIEEGKAEARRQRAIFEAGKAEILAAHPGKHIAVCAGEVFAGDTVEEAAQMARRAHGGRASFFYTLGHRPDDLRG